MSQFAASGFVWKRIDCFGEHIVFVAMQFVSHFIDIFRNIQLTEVLFIISLRTELNLSSNQLSNIERDAFASLVNLKSLTLFDNQLENTILDMPNSLERISMASNKLKYFPFTNVPLNLNVLELQNNNLVEIVFSGGVSKTIDFTHLMIFNLSHNEIESLPSTVRYSELKVFDLSFNKFTEIPQNVGDQTTTLNRLILSGNPLTKIHFNKTIFVRNIELNHLKLLNEIDASQFEFIGKYHVFIACFHSFFHVFFFTFSLNQNRRMVASNCTFPIVQR